ncbi:MAG: N-acetylneuraminate synthase family protein [Deltaproteobacteria bacterium]|nr:N-acetylneuraminate synthase family protein [Deltaproteobacteria bacterium]
MRKPDIIAEIGVNYYDIAKKQNISLVDAARKMISACKKVGVNRVKFQTYKADKLAADNSPSYWDTSEETTTSQKELFSKFDKLTKKEYLEIVSYCNDIGVEFMSTPFDLESAEFIDTLVSVHKIASADITNFPLLDKIASFKKPIILSTGASTYEEVSEAVKFLEDRGCDNLSLLHCVLSYPTAEADANLWKIKALKEKFPHCKVGLSDHTKYSLDVLTTAWLLGAEIIEKHYTIDKKLQGNDHYHAADPEDFMQFLNKVEQLIEINGEEENSWVFDCERAAVTNARRGCYLDRSINKGDTLKYEDILFLRPQLEGLSPKDLLSYLKKKATYTDDLEIGTLIREADLNYD